MNRSMIKAAAAVCVLSLLTAAVPAGAAEWINLSSWAYAEVSGFVSDGLLPERLKDESDYTRVMTRGEFAEVVYSVLYDTGRLQEDKNSEHFGDCFEYPDINRLYSYIYEALINDSVYDEENRLFYPELPITRSDAAVILYSALENIGLIDYGSGVVWLEEEDAAEFLEEQGLLASDLNGLSVKVQAIINTILESEIMSGTGGGSFEPDKPLTIEQGIAAAYRLYKAIPRLIYSDDEGIEDKTEQLIQTYDCGLSEFYRDKNYIIADGEKELLKLESDVYSKLFCCEYGGKKLVFAVNFNDKTDVYDPETGSVLYTIPYIVYDFNTEKGWVYVYSSRFMPAYSGLYSMAGTELIAPEYSEKEISEIAANGFIVPREERRAADGWIDYANWNDNGHLYKIDSNGENEQLLVGDSDCTNTRYLDGIIYYNVNDDDFSLRCVDENGGSRYVISDTRASLYAGYTVRFWTEDLPEDSMEYYVEQRDSYGNKLTNDYFTDFYRSRQGLGCFGGYLLYSEEADYTRTIVYSDGNSGEIRKDAVYLYKFHITENGVEKEKIADFPMMNVSWDETGERLYFMNADEIRDSGDSPVYVYNGESVSEVSPGLRAECFGFIYEDAELTGEIGYLTEEEIWNGTYHILDLSDGRIRQEQLDEYVPYEQEDTRIISEGGDPEIVRHLKDNELCVSFGGDTVSLGSARYFDTIGDHILYIPEEAQSDGWTMVSSNFLRADRMELKVYNYETGEIKTVSNDIAGISINSELLGDGVVYMTPQSQLKLVTEPVEKSETVYPNKGLHRYGKPVTIMRLSRVSWQKPYLYKVDSDGNVTQLTDCHTEKWLYVPNGSSEAEFSA